MKKTIWKICLTLAVCLAITVPASAKVVTLGVRGVVNSIHTEGGLALDGSVNIGSVMTGYCAYDTDTPDQYESDWWGLYEIDAISMTIGNYTLTHDLNSDSPILFSIGTIDYNYVVKTLSPRFDGTVTINGLSKTWDDINWSSSALTLLDVCSSSNELNLPDTLPESVPDISIFNWRREFYVRFVVDNGSSFYIYGEITSLTVVPAPFEVIPASVDFHYYLGDSNPEPQTLSIWANGIDTLNWQITEDCNWLDVSPTTGQSSGEVDEVTLTVDISGLAPGSYHCQLTIFDPNVPDYVLHLPVNLFIGSKLLVPGQYPTIQAAIDAADDYDVVLVADGTYTGPGNRDIDFLGKAITVRSENGPENCIIDCQATEDDQHRGFYFHNYENTDSILEGFTITNGYSYDGAIQCWQSSPTIKNCNIVQNQGGGIYCGDSCPTITNCKITGNSADDGGGISCWRSSPTITNCIINGNSAWIGGGISCWDSSSPKITNCIITNNLAENFGGGVFGEAIISNCIIRDNLASEVEGAAVVTYCNIKGGYAGEGNIDADPCFAFSTDYHLMLGSPCIDAGDPNYISGPNETDFEGNPRIIGGRIDMGVYENSPDSPSIAISPSSLSFSYFRGWSEPEPQTLLIRNCGGEILHWQIVEDCNWLQVTPTNGISNGQINEVTLTVDSSGLALGHYSCVLQVLDANAVNSPVTIPVTFHVGEILRVPDDFFTIQAAIDAADDYDMVLVADGTYTGDGNRDIDFLGKAITVKSESGPENCIIDCNGTAERHRGFYFHRNEDSDSILEGFTITNGYPQYGYGGGAIQCKESSPTIKNCNIMENHQGGGIYCYRSNSTITNCFVNGNVSYARNGGGGISILQSICLINNCTISGNKARDGGGISIFSGLCLINNCIITANSAERDGGGISLLDYGSFTINNCTITGNSAERDGGGIALFDYGSFTINNCTITGNSADYNGGGMHNHKSNPTLTNCTFSGNEADYDGGGIYNTGSTPTLTNCTFSANSATNGNAFALDSYKKRYPSSVQVTNCLLWDGGDEIWNNDGSSITITYSDVQGSWPGEGNIDSDPCFVSPGYWADVNDTNIIVEPNDPNAVWIDGDYYLLAGSPCIDAGDNSVVTVDTDLDGNPRIFDGNDDGNSVVDMGAYEFVPPLEVAMKFTPQALNLRSKGKWVKAHFVLPEGFLPEDVNTNTPVVIEPLGIESDHMNVFINEDGLVKIKAAFSRSDFCGSAISDDTIEVTVVGLLTTGRYFYGTDTIKIINKSLEPLAAFASHWLQTDCRKPHWCAGLDVNQDSVINFIDFAMFDTCCFEVIKQ